MSDPVLEVKGLTKVFKAGRRNAAVVAAKDISFALAEGKVIGLVGESGSGKTTIGRMICGIETPTDGQILLHARKDTTPVAITGKADHKRVQMVFQDPYASLNPFNTVRYTVMRPLLNHLRLSASEALARAEDLMDTVRLTPALDYLSKRPDQLSGGQRQRVVIARALAAEPEVIVADEPVSMLDVSIRAEVVSLLDDLRKTGRIRGMLYITHDLLSARQLADEIIVLYKGRVVEQGQSDSILGDPKHPYTQVLLAALPNPRRAREGGQTGITLSSDGPVALTGCAFAPRCPFVMDTCRTVDPPLLKAGEGRSVACHVVNG